MILECPACAAKFTVPDSALGAAGREVRCGKCKHLWHAKPAGAPVGFAYAHVEEIPAAPVRSKPAASKPAPDFDALMSRMEEPVVPDEAVSVYGSFATPMFMRKKWFRVAFYSFAYVVVLAVLAYALSLKFKPEWFGHQASHGFSFESVKVERMVQLGGERFSNTPLYTVKTIIRNTSDQAKQRPMVRIALHDNTGGEVYSALYPSPDSVIPAGGAVVFEVERLKRPSEDSYFSVEMGNRLELAMRNIGYARD